MPNMSVLLSAAWLILIIPKPEFYVWLASLQTTDILPQAILSWIVLYDMLAKKKFMISETKPEAQNSKNNDPEA